QTRGKRVVAKEAENLAAHLRHSKLRAKFTVQVLEDEKFGVWRLRGQSHSQERGNPDRAAGHQERQAKEADYAPSKSAGTEGRKELGGGHTTVVVWKRILPTQPYPADSDQLPAAEVNIHSDGFFSRDRRLVDFSGPLPVAVTAAGRQNLVHRYLGPEPDQMARQGG
ncbi:hypothetical protein MMC29_008230, partial [Sticta canariensis]|nr:hypothetical protein [Sticta canariensis]